MRPSLKSLLLPMQALILWSAGSAAAANLVVNGDFESGNTGFETEYIYAPGCGGVGGEGIYTVAGNNCYGPGIGGPSGSGNLYFANGAIDNTQYVWRQTVTLEPGTKYYFSAHAASGVTDNPPVLDIQVSTDGACASAATFSSIGSITATTTVWQWIQSTGFFTNAAGTSACLRLINNNAAANGNDYGLDDIVLDAVYAVTSSVSGGGAGTAVCTPTVPVTGGLANEFLSGGGFSCTATPDAGSTFTGWTGACAGQPETCTVTNATANAAVVAQFVGPTPPPPPPPPTVTSIPTLSEWALIVLSMALAGFAWLGLRRGK